ncbi:MAG TPA: 2-dehydro-3-deoxygluconokinase [Clostridiales bacterium]|nr:sugar kinase [Eubacteriales bacterium]HBR32241.1 2-dehydro-3-deoxygluconokinase [Clostridiales bacterium]
MKKTVCFGEVMLRLQPPSYQRFLQARSFDAVYGGGEANVAISLSQYGLDSVYVTKLPNNPLGIACRNEIRKWGVDTTKIVFGGDRLGIYFCEKGASQRPSNVIYDRAGSSISRASESDFNWDEIFDGADWFHFTGITPALGDTLAAICEKACAEAKKRDITISCDLNFRKKLWSRQKAGEVMSRLCKFVDVLIANEEDSADVFDIHSAKSDINSGVLSYEGYTDVAKQLIERFGFKYVAITLRESVSASVNNWSGMLYDGDKAYFSTKYCINIVDRVGGGDSFGAGLIYAMLNKKTPAEAIEFAAAASCLKHTVEGDCNIATAAEVESLIKNGGSGRVQR